MAERTEQQRRKNALHKAAQRKLRRLFRRYGPGCHWCSCHLILGQGFDRTRIRRETNSWVWWIDDHGQEQRSRWATADHLLPIRDGGESNIENLVLACGSCNNARQKGWRNPNPDPPKWKGQIVCKCGAEKLLNDYRCHRCMEASAEAKKLSRKTFIARMPGGCGWCGAALVLLRIIEPFGPFYGCPQCVRGKAGRLTEKGA